MGEAVGRLLIGGLFVPAFPVLGYGRRPKNFAGLFGTLPSVSPATFRTAAYSPGAAFAAMERRSPFSGAVAVSFMHPP